MKRQATERVKVYMRFHRSVNGVLHDIGLQRVVHDATAASEIINEYLSDLSKRCGHTLMSASWSDLSFSDISSSFYVRRGRASESILGKPMNITLNKVDYHNITLLSLKFGLSVRDFLSSIIISYAVTHHLI